MSFLKLSQKSFLEHIVHPCQSAFIPNRAIGDNIIINHEIMHYMNSKIGKTRYMAIKVDLAKAYDRIEWRVLCHIMVKLGFKDNFIRLIEECISTTQFSVLLNGSPHGYFTTSKGLR